MTQQCAYPGYSTYSSGYNYFCQSNWDDPIYTDINTKAGCCGGVLSDSSSCDPESCPLGTDASDSANCQATMESFCTSDVWGGVTLPPDSSFSAPTACDNYIKSSAQGVKLNSNGLSPSAALVQSAVNDFYVTNAHLPTDNHPFVSKAIDLCAQYPGTCDPILSTVCQNYTVSDLDPSTHISTWDPTGMNLLKTCGCFLPEAQYYTQGNMTVPCSTICNFPGTVPQGNPATGKANTCTGGVCVIDDVSLNLVNSYSGALNFNQICNACPPGEQCSCYLSNITLNSQDSTYGAESISSNCDTCFSLSNGQFPIATPISCNGQVAPGGGGGNQSPPSSTSSNSFLQFLQNLINNKVTWWSLGIAILFITLIVIAFNV
jgi:hypothetical protein